jgi:hypothetical protein
MTRIHLVVTGVLEKRAMHRSLQRACRVWSPEAEVRLLDPQRVEQFTTNPIPAAPAPSHPRVAAEARKMADAMIAAVVLGRRRSERADFAFGIVDLELLNRSNAAGVVEYFATHMANALGDWFGASEADRNRALRVREQCSFHLCVPMTEAYFFAEPEALVRAGCTRRSCFDPAQRDVECFRVDDPDYERAIPSDPGLEEVLARHPGLRSCDDPAEPLGSGLDWWRAHPKHYIEFLSENAYHEARQGVAALATLAWPSVVAPANQSAFARSLIDDLIEAVSPGRGAAIPGARQPLTERRAGRFLRNIG